MISGARRYRKLELLNRIEADLKADRKSVSELREDMKLLGQAVSPRWWRIA